LSESFKTEKGQRIGCESGDRPLVAGTEGAEEGQAGESCFAHEKKLKLRRRKLTQISHQACGESCNWQPSAGIEDGNVFGREPVSGINNWRKSLFVLLDRQRKLIDRNWRKGGLGTAKQVMTSGNRRNSLHCSQLAAGIRESGSRIAARQSLCSASETKRKLDYGNGRKQLELLETVISIQTGR
jgi:hypothetical protein